MIKDNFVEVFRYRVVYPGGTYVRISPNVESEKTGVVLEYGTIFESTKSLFLDSVNYIKVQHNSSSSNQSSSTGIAIDPFALLSSDRNASTTDITSSSPSSLSQDGWVFESKGGVEILQLVDIRRRLIEPPSKKANDSNTSQHNPDNNNPSSSISSNIMDMMSRQYQKSFSSKLTPIDTEATSSTSSENSIAINQSSAPTQQSMHSPQPSSTSPKTAEFSASKSKEIRMARNETKYWRDVRSMSLSCHNFYDFMKMVSELEYQATVEEVAGNTWTPQTQREQQIRGLVTLLATVTKKCVDGVSDCSQLEAALWVLLHLGARTMNIIEYAADAANQRYEKLDVELQRSLLQTVLEVGGRTKALGSDLSKLMDILPDDIRNFLQRWVFIKAIVTSSMKKSISDQSEKVGVVDMNEPNDEDGIINAPPSSFRRTPATVAVAPRNSWWSMLPASVPRCEVNIMSAFPSSSTASVSTATSNSSTPSPTPPQQPSIYGQYFTDLRQRINQVMNDPEVQFANMI